MPQMELSPITLQENPKNFGVIEAKEKKYFIASPIMKTKRRDISQGP